MASSGNSNNKETCDSSPDEQEECIEISASTQKEKNAPSKKKRSRAETFSNNELILLCVAWVQASENGLTGNNQKLQKFWESVGEAYEVQRGEYNSYLRDQKSISKRLRDLFTDSVMSEAPARSASSLQQKFSKDIQPICRKLVGIEKTVDFENGGPSGYNGDEDKLFSNMCTIFQKRFSTSAAKYRGCWKYLRSNPKFQAYCVGFSENEGGTKKGKRGIEVKPEANTFGERPMGNSATKKKMKKDDELAKLVKNSSSAAITGDEMRDGMKRMENMIVNMQSFMDFMMKKEMEKEAKKDKNNDTEE